MFSRADDKNETEIVSIVFGAAVVLVRQQRARRLSHLLYDQVHHLPRGRARRYVQLDAGSLAKTCSGGGIDAQHAGLCLLPGIGRLTAREDRTSEVSVSTCCHCCVVKAEFVRAGAAARCRLVLCHAASVAMVTKVTRHRRVVSGPRYRGVDRASQL